MKKDKHLAMMVDREVHYKLHYIAKYEGRSANGQVLYLLNQCIIKFEAENGKIEIPVEKD